MTFRSAPQSSGRIVPRLTIVGGSCMDQKQSVWPVWKKTLLLVIGGPAVATSLVTDARATLAPLLSWMTKSGKKDIRLLAWSAGRKIQAQQVLAIFPNKLSYPRARRAIPCCIEPSIEYCSAILNSEIPWMLRALCLKTGQSDSTWQLPESIACFFGWYDG